MSDYFVGTIQLFAFNYPPKNWALCNGQLLAINTNQALFSLLGTAYGGDGIRTFALPDLRGRTLISTQLNNSNIGELGGEEKHTLLLNEMAGHNHTLMTDSTTPGSSNSNTPTSGSVLGASAGTGAATNVYIYTPGGTPNNALTTQSVGNTGNSQSHDNRMPYLVMNYCIALSGVFPSRS